MTRLSTNDLLTAAYQGNRSAIDAHLKAGGDINVQRADGFTPLIVAMEGKHPELAAELVDKGADVRHRMPGGFSALHVLIKHIRNRPVSFSVTVTRKGKQVTLTDPDEVRKEIGSHPDDEYRAWLNLAGKLLDGGVDVEAAKEATGQRALRDAAEASDDLVAMMLERARPDVNAADKEGLTPLHMAARIGNVRTVELLLKAGADVDAAEGYGFTPLHEAILNKRRDAARRLLAAGADPAKKITRGYGQQKAGDDARAMAKATGMLDVFEAAPAAAPVAPAPSVEGHDDAKKLANAFQFGVSEEAAHDVARWVIGGDREAFERLKRHTQQLASEPDSWWRLLKFEEGAPDEIARAFELAISGLPKAKGWIKWAFGGKYRFGGRVAHATEWFAKKHGLAAERPDFPVTTNLAPSPWQYVPTLAAFLRVVRQIEPKEYAGALVDYMKALADIAAGRGAAFQLISALSDTPEVTIDLPGGKKPRRFHAIRDGVVVVMYEAEVGAPPGGGRPKLKITKAKTEKEAEALLEKAVAEQRKAAKS